MNGIHDAITNKLTHFFKSIFVYFFKMVSGKVYAYFKRLFKTQKRKQCLMRQINLNQKRIIRINSVKSCIITIYLPELEV